jgi:Lsr2
VAQKVSVTYACDYDGKDIPRGQETTRSFGVDGREYDIDLCRKHNERLSQVLGPYLEVSRRSSRTPRRRRTMAHRQRSAEIRSWAKQRGIEVSDRGRIPANVVSRFEAAEREPISLTAWIRWAASAAQRSRNGAGRLDFTGPTTAFST